MAKTKKKSGDRVWVCIESRIYEVELRDGSIDGFWETAGKFTIGNHIYHTSEHKLFPTLDSLLDDLRSRAIHLPKE